MSRWLIVLICVLVLMVVGAFIALAVWNIPVIQQTVEKPVEVEKLLEAK